MPNPPAITRRQALTIGAGVLGAAVLAPRSLASATITGSTVDCEPRFTGYWHGPSNPYNEIGAGRSMNLVTNGSFEDGPPGPTAPGWTFILPPA